MESCIVTWSGSDDILIILGVWLLHSPPPHSLVSAMMPLSYGRIEAGRSALSISLLLYSKMKMKCCLHSCPSVCHPWTGSQALTVHDYSQAKSTGVSSLSLPPGGSLKLRH